ncbi:MAG TPA: DHH family phosphoesterase [Candidatus Cloacimonadota bacterium]|nr:DHH family phosphoesterase [Candidatus Cloacimonadota bacterium]HPS38779.1 DHH family phosphoesterase [Candidatus Cloacimonadota bacterium]
MVINWREPRDSSEDLLKQILAHRGIGGDDLIPGLELLPDEALCANIDKVAERIRQALYRNESMVIFGHDDPDGVTSTYILYQYLNSCGYQKHHYFIPNRNLESHGIQQSVIDYVREGGFKLLITVDNGISAWQGVTELNALGCEVVITDHHLVQPDQLPPAYTIMNPQLPECQYPFKALSGVGVALILIRYLSRILEHPVPPSSYFWAAVGSIADKVPMIGVNRRIVRFVLDNWDIIPDYTIEFLIRNYPRINSRTDIFNFMVNTSRLIANGREPGGQHTALRFMLQVSDEKAELFQDLEKQKNLWEHELNSVFGFMDILLNGFSGSSFVYFDDEDAIPYNLLGTAATYVVNNLGIPAIMLKLHNGVMVCEGRCSEGINMVSAFTHCKEHLIQYGGHAKAAGFSMLPEKYDDFLDCYSEYISAQTSTDTEPEVKEVDAVIVPDDLTPENWEKLEILLPWGMKNPEPVLMLKNCSMQELRAKVEIENGNHPGNFGQQYQIVVTWKSPQQVRILDYHKV